MKRKDRSGPKRFPERNGFIAIHGRKHRGFRADRRCETCRERLVYAADHDAFFCVRCDSWSEAACGDGHCRFCADRPFAPAEAGIETDQSYEIVVARIAARKRRRERDFLRRGARKRGTEGDR